MQLGVEGGVSEAGTMSPSCDKEGMSGLVLSVHPGRSRYYGDYVKD